MAQFDAPSPLGRRKIVGDFRLQFCGQLQRPQFVSRQGAGQFADRRRLLGVAVLIALVGDFRQRLCKLLLQAIVFFELHLSPAIGSIVPLCGGAVDDDHFDGDGQYANHGPVRAKTFRIDRHNRPFEIDMASQGHERQCPLKSILCRSPIRRKAIRAAAANRLKPANPDQPCSDVGGTCVNITRNRQCKAYGRRCCRR